MAAALAQRAALPHPLYSIPQQNLMPRNKNVTLSITYNYILIIINVIECEYKDARAHWPTNQSSSSSCTPMLLLCTDVAHQDHLSHAPHEGLYYACTVQLLGIKTCINNRVILGDGTNLCLQAEMDMIMITTGEGRHENEGSDTNVVL